MRESSREAFLRLRRYLYIFLGMFKVHFQYKTPSAPLALQSNHGCFLSKNRDIKVVYSMLM